MLIVVALMASTFVLAAPVLDTLVQTQDLSSESDLVVDALREAQSSAMTGYDGGVYGVHFMSGDYTLFRGATYNISDPDNIVHEFPGFVGIIDVTLEGGGNDVIYRNHRGTTQQPGSVTLVDAGGNTVTVSIGESGLIQKD
jgi:hypothetical protein